MSDDIELPADSGGKVPAAGQVGDSRAFQANCA